MGDFDYLTKRTSPAVCVNCKHRYVNRRACNHCADGNNFIAKTKKEYSTGAKPCKMCGVVIEAGRHPNILFCDDCKNGLAKDSPLPSYLSTKKRVWSYAQLHNITVPDAVKIIVDSFLSTEMQDIPGRRTDGL